MSSHCFQFNPSVPFAEAEATLALAVMATEALFGPEAVALQAGHRVFAADRVVEIDSATAAGMTLAQLFLGYARREFGYHALAVRCTKGAE